MIKELFNVIVGLLGSVLTYCFGGWSMMLETLILFIVLDYLTGIICAAVFKKSSKTESGALSSKVGFKGILKKCMILIMIMVAYRIDLVLNANNLILNAVILAFTSNEAISILENCTTMGLPIPKVLQNAVDTLKGDEEDESNIL